MYNYQTINKSNKSEESMVYPDGKTIVLFKH